MKLDLFCTSVDFDNKSEIEKTELFLLYLTNEKDHVEFSFLDVLELFEKQNYSCPNKSRLRNKIRKAKSIIIDKKDNIRLHATKLNEFKKDYPKLFNNDENIEEYENILPKSLYDNTRGYIEKLSIQINSCYEHNLFDGCAVLMRRLLEILLIHSYQNYKIDSEIKDSSDNYYLLEKIVANALSNKKLDLSRNIKSNLNDYRDLGNFAAHKIQFNTKKFDIDKLKNNYRVDIEELLYKSGIKK